MMPDTNNDELIFDSGDVLYANNCIIGISPELEISEGYDGGIVRNNLTKEQRAELADYAISLWKRFKELEIK